MSENAETQEEADTSTVLAIAAEAAVRWREALDVLATQ